MTTEASDARSHEKTAVAGLSALAATGLTVGKLIVGLMTGSIAILSEAAHSGLDLLASLITFLAVRVASQPPDELHPYGHQKAENVAAYTEMLFLLGTCTWITIEATKRLLHWHGESVVKLSVWAYAMVAVSICVDWWRSTALMRAARKHSSQALEADALHFRADLWSSCVVLTGLAVMGLG
ncbi:MAG: cation transporter, partial [Armatimonadetes bacterium]|nr:cation transporter [Armatimonadota bacterium]